MPLLPLNTAEGVFLFCVCDSLNSGRGVGQEDRDGYRLKDRTGHTILCYKCNQSASIPKQRRILSCDFCDMHWHLDCLDPPMTGMPPPTRKWMCPVHSDLEVVRSSSFPEHPYLTFQFVLYVTAEETFTKANNHHQRHRTLRVQQWRHCHLTTSRTSSNHGGIRRDCSKSRSLSSPRRNCHSGFLGQSAKWHKVCLFCIRKLNPSWF